MSPDKEQAIFDRYPAIFRDHTKSATESCMHWGLEVGDGWADIIDALCRAIDRPTQGMAGTAEDGVEGMFEYTFPQVVADQVKSKFAGLRFYYHLEPDAAFQEQAQRYPKTAAKLMDGFRGYVDGAIALAEVLASRTCETTGAPGKMYVRGGWYVTASPAEAAKHGYKEADQ